jgi:hypothetical protein
MHTVGHEIWKEKLENVKNEKCNNLDLDLARKLNSWKIEIHTVRHGIGRETLKNLQNEK